MRAPEVAMGASARSIPGLLILLAACGGEPDGPSDGSVESVAVETIDGTATDPQDDAGVIEIDLRREDRVWAFDPTHGAIDYSRVLLTCPNGAVMSMEVWLDDLSKDLGLDVTAGGAASIALGLPTTKQAVVQSLPPIDAGNPDCADCTECPDGAFVCWDMSCLWAAGGEGDWTSDSHAQNEGMNSGNPVPGPQY
jgi:hypothetical protein